MIDRANILRKRIRWLTGLFIVGLVISGVTAIPLEWEVDWLARFFAPDSNQMSSDFARWILIVREGLHQTNAQFPFMAYGTDWLAFGHFVIAIAFVGALRDPVRNCWLFDFGLIACALVVPYAICLGGLRGIPIYWRLIDCSFGILGFVPLWICKRSVAELSRSNPSPE